MVADGKVIGPNSWINLVCVGEWRGKEEHGKEEEEERKEERKKEERRKEAALAARPRATGPSAPCRLRRGRLACRPGARRQRDAQDDWTASTWLSHLSASAWPIGPSRPGPRRQGPVVFDKDEWMLLLKKNKKRALFFELINFRAIFKKKLAIILSYTSL